MALDFNPKDITHQVITKYVQAYLPGAKKKYNAKAVLQPELDIHGVASKAGVYNITTSPKVIEEGFNAAAELIYYLVADGYKILTPLFHLGIRIPGEYDGMETHLPPGIHPEVRLVADNGLRNYVRDHVQIVFDGIDETTGFIGQVVDESTGLIDQVVTLGNIVTLHGSGLKVEGDAAHASEVGVFLVVTGGTEYPVKAIALNEPRTLKLLMPDQMSGVTQCYILIRTQSSAKSSNWLIKEVRTVKTDFMLNVQG